MALKKTQPESTGPKIDYNFLYSQVEDDTHDARVSTIIDAGMQQPAITVYGIKMNKDNVSYFATNEDALDYIDKAEDIVGTWVADKEGYTEQPEEVDATQEIISASNLDVEVGAIIYKLDFRIVTPKPREEVMYAGDLVDMAVEYVEGEEPKQYRVWLNQQDFMTKQMKGFSTKFAPPMKDGGLWTFSPLSMHTKLAEATGKTSILKSGDDFGDLSLLLGQPFGIPTTQKETTSKGKDYVNLKVGAPVRLSKKALALGITELDCTPEAISFEDVTVEQLENIMPNRLVIAKIKMAINYEGSQMQKAIEEWEANKSGGSTSNEKTEDSQEEESPKAEKKKAPTKKAAPEKVEEEDEDEDDDNPF